MKKLVVQINRQRFELESSGREEDSFILATAQELTEKIELLRRERGFPDSSRATLLAALLVALEAKTRHNTGSNERSAADASVIKTLNEQIEGTLARTNGSIAKTFTQ